MSYPRLAGRLYNVPLLVEAGKAAIIESVFRAHVEGHAAELPQAPQPRAAAGEQRARRGYTLVDGGVAIIPVHGTLVQRAGSMDAMSGLTGYNMIAGRLQSALDDSDVRGIVMEFDSPGGEVGGVFELAERILKTSKPIFAHANEMAFSAAYALACAAEELYVAPTGMVGSVGVIMLHVDQSQLDANRGLVYTPIFAGARKNDFSSHEPLSDEARDTGQAEIDRLYGIFVNHVARARGISPEAVRETEAGLLNPEQALEVGMADGAATLSETVQRMRARLEQDTTTYSRPSRALSERSITMSNTDKGAGATAATEQQIAEAEARGRAAATAEQAKLLAEATANAATAAQARISAILTHAEATGRRTLAEHLAFKTQTTAEDAAAILATAPKEAPADPKAGAPADLLAAAMGKVANPKIGADAGGDDEGEETEAQYGARIAKFAQRTKLQAVPGKTAA